MSKINSENDDDRKMTVCVKSLPGEKVAWNFHGIICLDLSSSSFITVIRPIMVDISNFKVTHRHTAFTPVSFMVQCENEREKQSENLSNVA